MTTKFDVLAQQLKVTKPEKLLQEFQGDIYNEENIQLIKAFRKTPLPDEVINVIFYVTILVGNFKVNRNYAITLATHYITANIKKSEDAMNLAIETRKWNDEIRKYL